MVGKWRSTIKTGVGVRLCIGGIGGENREGRVIEVRLCAVNRACGDGLIGTLCRGWLTILQYP